MRGAGCALEAARQQRFAEHCDSRCSIVISDLAGIGQHLNTCVRNIRAGKLFGALAPDAGCSTGSAAGGCRQALTTQPLSN